MVPLVLTDEEQSLLKEILESELADLRMEIRDTSTRDFKEMLKQKERVMEKILTILQQSEEHSNAL